jgi:hypothetical protein
MSRYLTPQREKLMHNPKQKWLSLKTPIGKRSISANARLACYGGLLILPILAGSALADNAITADRIEWQLSRGRIVDQGDSTALPQGIQTLGYVIEASVQASDGGLIPQGTLRLTLSSFTPLMELPGQKLGYTYLQGKWTLTDQTGTGTSKHSPGVVSGVLNAELQFDPIAEPGTWSAKAILPMSTITPVGSEGIQWARGSGELTLSGELEGELELNVDLWPVTTAGK